MPTNEPKVPLSLRVSPEVKEQLDAEAERFNRKPSDHARTILADYFAGRSIERVREELTELQEEVHSLREQLGSHTEAVYFVLRLFVAQQGLTDEQWKELDAQFKKVLKTRG